MILELLHAAARGDVPAGGRADDRGRGRVRSAGRRALVHRPSRGGGRRARRRGVGADRPGRTSRARSRPACWPGWRSGPGSSRAASTSSSPGCRGAPVKGSPVREIEPGGHPRVDRARRWRSDLRVFEGDSGMVLLGRGVAGRLELSVEVAPGGAIAGSRARLVGRRAGGRRRPASPSSPRSRRRTPPRCGRSSRPGSRRSAPRCCSAPAADFLRRPAGESDVRLVD